MDSTLGQDQGQYHEANSMESSSETSNSVASAPDKTALYTPTEQYGSWAQYEQIQYQTATVLQSTPTVTDQMSGQYYVYPTQESQAVEPPTYVSAAEAAHFAISSTAQTYQVVARPDASETYAVPSAPATAAYDSVSSFTTYASAHSQHTAETAFLAQTQIQQPLPSTPQGLPEQPTYMTQAVANNQFQDVASTTTSWLPAQASVLDQAQYTVQGDTQTCSSSPYQTLAVTPDGQYYTQVPLSTANHGPEVAVYQAGPGNVLYMTTQSATGQMMVQTQPQSSSSGRKIWNKETAVHAKEATINATKKAYGKSKEFIVNKDGARAMAKTTWRQSKDVMIKTTDLMDKYVKPLMPLIAAADPELAASLRATSQVGRMVKTQDRKQNSAQGKNGPGVGSDAAQQNAAHPQLDAAALANLAPLLALLQQTTQLNAASGNQQGNDAQAQARLLAALLQVQLQQPQQAQIQPQAQQPQIQQPQQSNGEQQQQQQQQYQVQQPLAHQQSKTSPPQSSQGQTQQPQIQDPMAGQPYVQQQHAPQSQNWQQPAQQPTSQQQQQQQHKIPRRKPVSSNPASHQPTATPAPSAFAAASPPPDTEQLASLVDSQLTLQEQPNTHDHTQNITTDAWTHHAFRNFGIEDILLPPGAELTPSQTTPRTVMVGKLLPEADVSFEIESFPNSTLLQDRINALQSIPMPGFAPLNPAPETQLLEPLAVRPELNPAALVAADCLVGLSAGQQTSYRVLLQSAAPQGYGISISSTSVAAATQAAKDAVGRVARSILWATVLEDVFV
ncbi:hypothetical protein BR93DRAFT_937086 [Coniochaeta sp. PMI_546]|nr:hypothetical protein BR93DRAFT_937086 [Coniochaeta sp. PMI_546]